MNLPPLPLHLLRGDHPLLDGLLGALPWGLVAVRLLLGVGLVVTGGPALIGGIALFVVWGLLSRRRVRSCAAPIGEEAVVLLAGAGLLLGATGDGAVALATGVVAGPVLLALLLGAVWWTWGWRPTPVKMRQPWFRVLGDNPAAVTWITKVRVGEDGVVVGLDRCAHGPVSAVLYRLGLGSVGGASWEELQADYQSGHAEVLLTAPPGRYLLSVRYYRPFPTVVAPRVAS